MPVNSRRKGKTGELEWAKYLKENSDTEARRGMQFCGSPDSPDVVSDDRYFYEVKRRNRLSIYEAMAQAVKDSEGSGKIPTIAWRKDRGEWLIVLRASDFIRIKD